MRSLTDMHTVTISVMEIELIALKKLALVSHVLAQKIGGQSGAEQKCLADVLDETIRKIELAAAGVKAA